MVKIRSLVFVFVCLLASGLVAAQTIDAGRGNLPMKVPAGYASNTPSPLIVLLHGYSFSGEFQDNYMGLSKLADRYGFLFVAPDGTKEPGDNGNRYWNASSACCDFTQSGVDDSAYVLNIISTVKSTYTVDPNRVFLIGHSNGGFLSYRVAYDHGNTIAAIASLAGANHLEVRPAPSSAVHVLQIHGTADTVISYGGADIQGNAYPGALESVSRWASYNGCSTEGAERELRDLDSGLAGHETTVLTFRQGCKAGGSAELWTIQGGSHVPNLSESFSEQVVEWLFAHPQ